MFKRIILVITLVGVLLLGFWVWEKGVFLGSGGDEVKELGREKIYHAQLHDVDISNIEIKAYYFVPKNVLVNKDFNFQEKIKQALEDLCQFYQQQTFKRIRISYVVYPEVVFGQKAGEDYDVGDTSKGNPTALSNISKELQDRDLKIPDTLTLPSGFGKAPSSYRVNIIFYEGVGSSATIFTNDEFMAKNSGLEKIDIGETPTVLVSTFYFTQEGVADYSSSILAHEFGHILGFLDGFDMESGKPFTTDIMGSGRFKPINRTFISLENLKKLGISF